MGETSWPAVQQLEVDGTPLLWIDAPPPVEAELLFRVGRADETLATAGITHLVEHLAMPPALQVFECNAWVADSTTGFRARGSEAEVAGFLADTVARLRALPVERLELERRILRAEESQSGSHPIGGLLGVRFGARDYGLGGEQLGLRGIGAAEIVAWAERFFVRGNAVLWVRGPLPELRLDLHAGDRRPPPLVRLVDWQPLPAAVSGFPDAVWASLLGTAGPAFSAACGVLAERLLRALRFESGLVYTVESHHGPLTGDVFHSVFWSQCTPDRAEAVCDGLLAAVDALVAAGPSPAELERQLAAHVRAAGDPAALGDILGPTAIDVLLGRELEQPEAYVEELRAVTPEAAAAALGEALATAVVALPGDMAIADARFAAVVDRPATVPVEGKTVKRSRLAFGAGRRERLVVGSEGVTVFDGEGESLTVRYESCAAACVWPDGTLGLWGEHGFLIELWPVHWRDGAAVVAEIEAALPPGVLVPMTADDPKWLDPALSPER